MKELHYGFLNVPCYDSEEEDDLPPSAFCDAPIISGAIPIPEVNTTLAIESTSTASREPVSTTTSITFQTAATSSGSTSHATSNTSVATTTLSSIVGAHQTNTAATKATAKKKSKDQEIYEKIDLNYAGSIDKFFKFHDRKGTLKPIPSVLGCSSNYKTVFREIHEWRKLTQSAQETRKQNFIHNTTEKEKRAFRKKIALLMKKESIQTHPPVSNTTTTITNTITNTNSIIANGSSNTNNSVLSSSSEKQRSSTTSASTTSAASTTPATHCFNLTSPSFIRRAAAAAIKVHGAVKRHIGLASAQEDRVGKLNEIDKEKSVHKRRKIGERPQFAYQAGDSVGRRELHLVMKQFGRYIDTVTLKRDDANLDGDKRPRNIAVMMVLNKVSQSSMNGGARKANDKAKRNKPEFILLAESQLDCKDVITAFSECCTTKQHLNKKDDYDFSWIKPDEITGKIRVTVDNFIEEEKKKRQSWNTKPISLEEIQDSIAQDGVGTVIE